MVTLSRGALVLFTFLLFLAGGIFGAGVVMVARPKPAQFVTEAVSQGSKAIGEGLAVLASGADATCASCGQALPRAGGGK